MFKGVFTALVSPFTVDGHLDLRAFEGLLEWQADNGVQGFVPCGTTGENPTLTRDEWRQLVQASVKVARRRSLSVIAGCGSNNTVEVIELISQASELGANAALVVTPYYNKPNQRGLIAHYEAIAEKSALPIILYNVPGRTNVSLSVDTIKHLFKNDKIVGIKEASGSYAQWLQLANEVDLSKKALLAGDDDAFAAILGLGGTGIISATANVIPSKFVQIYQAALEQNWALAHQTQKELFPLIRAMFIETNPSPVKYALSLTQRVKNNLRLPLVTVSPQSESLIKSSLLEVGCL